MAIMGQETVPNYLSSTWLSLGLIPPINKDSVSANIFSEQYL
jgi:hypothetical protein